MKIRQATLEDIPAILEMGDMVYEESPVYRRFTRNYKKQYAVITQAIMRSDTVALVPDDMSGMLVGQIEEQLWFDEYIAASSVLYVKPEFRGTSRLFDLVHAFEAWSKDLGVMDIALGVSSGIHTDEVGVLYERLGYQKLGLVYRKEI